MIKIRQFKFVGGKKVYLTPAERSSSWLRYPGEPFVASNSATGIERFRFTPPKRRLKVNNVKHTRANSLEEVLVIRDEWILEHLEIFESNLTDDLKRILKRLKSGGVIGAIDDQSYYEATAVALAAEKPEKWPEIDEAAAKQLGEYQCARNLQALDCLDAKGQLIEGKEGDLPPSLTEFIDAAEEGLEGTKKRADLAGKYYVIPKATPAALSPLSAAGDRKRLATTAAEKPTATTAADQGFSHGIAPPTLLETVNEALTVAISPPDAVEDEEAPTFDDLVELVSAKLDDAEAKEWFEDAFDEELDLGKFLPIKEATINTTEITFNCPTTEQLKLIEKLVIGGNIKIVINN